MAVVGCLDDMIFTVSDEQIQTLSNWKWSGSARYATHQRHGARPLTEFVGINPDEIQFDIVFAWEMGRDPIGNIWKIFKWEREGTPLALTIGEHPYGYYRWTIVSHSSKIEYTDLNGNIRYAVVSVRLQEYLKE